MSNASMRNRREATIRRVAERREREDRAPRLTALHPSVASLSFEFREQSSAVANDVVYIRRIMVEAAPALFEIPCGDPTCEGGGHDITVGTLRSLREHEETFTGESFCHGSTRNASCSRVLRWVGTVNYKTS